MKTILSIFMTAALILSTLTGCMNSRAGRIEEARVTPEPTMTATSTPRPTATTKPDATGSELGNAARDAMDDVGNAAGNVIDGVGNAVDDAMTGAGNAVDKVMTGVGDAVSGNDNTAKPTSPAVTARP